MVAQPAHRGEGCSHVHSRPAHQASQPVIEAQHHVPAMLDEAALEADQFHKLAAGELSRIQSERRFRHRSGQEVWVQTTAALVRDDWVGWTALALISIAAFAAVILVLSFRSEGLVGEGHA